MLNVQETEENRFAGNSFIFFDNTHVHLSYNVNMHTGASV